VFWGALGAGAAVSVSGFLLLFPFYVTDIFGMQIAQVVHSVVAVLFVALILGHIYIGADLSSRRFSASLVLRHVKESRSGRLFVMRDSTIARKSRSAPRRRDGGHGGCGCELRPSQPCVSEHEHRRLNGLRIERGSPTCRQVDHGRDNGLRIRPA
jgi:hypothetical protein